ncbi:MAG: hypothetical protein J0M04_18050 [Verrucomicrobia bacterium]|nr:hypothetical protein [Verrucomicrobiota bacterium]
MESGLTHRTGRFRIERAGPGDAPALKDLDHRIAMPGKIRFVFGRDPDYFNALRVEGNDATAHVCRDAETGGIVGCAHRCVRTVYLNGAASEVGYLGGLRLEERWRGGRILARAFRYLRELDREERVPFHLTSIMEENRAALAVLSSGKAGLPVYHDRGRFNAMAVGMEKPPAVADRSLEVRSANASDAGMILDFLSAEGPRRQFYPAYGSGDFGEDGRLLYGLAWSDIALAFRSGRLVGVVGAWDQRRYRQWRVTGYATPLRLFRGALNCVAALRKLPRLPAIGEPLRYFTLALNCVERDDPAVYACSLAYLIDLRRASYDFFLAGLHETDPLLPVLAALPHVPLPARLHLVAWPDHADVVAGLDPRMVPYLELGSL